MNLTNDFSYSGYIVVGKFNFSFSSVPVRHIQEIIFPLAKKLFLCT